jgi:spermidine/putrescine transport system permease protein
MGAGQVLLVGGTALAYALLFTPIVVVMVFSFNAPQGRFNLLWNHATLDNWLHPFRDEALTQAFVTSLGLALVASLVATVLGGLMALGLTRYRLRARTWVETLLVLPLSSPEVVLATSLLTLFVQANIPRGFVTLVIAHSLFCLSYAALTLKARMADLDGRLEEAAMDLGARPVEAFRRVTLPLIAPGLLAAFLLSFSLSLDDTIISLFTAGDTVTLPLYIAGAFQREISPQIHVLASLVFLVSTGLLAISIRWWPTQRP